MIRSFKIGRPKLFPVRCSVAKLVRVFMLMSTASGLTSTAADPSFAGFQHGWKPRSDSRVSHHVYVPAHRRPGDSAEAARTRFSSRSAAPGTKPSRRRWHGARSRPRLVLPLLSRSRACARAGLTVEDMLLQAVGAASDPSSGAARCLRTGFDEAAHRVAIVGHRTQLLPAVGCAQANRISIRRRTQ